MRVRRSAQCKGLPESEFVVGDVGSLVVSIVAPVDGETSVGDVGERGVSDRKWTVYEEE